MTKEGKNNLGEKADMYSRALLPPVVERISTVTFTQLSQDLKIRASSPKSSGLAEAKPQKEVILGYRNEREDSEEGFRNYLQEIGTVSLLTTEGERDLARRKETWDYAERIRLSIGADNTPRGARIFAEAYSRLNRATPFIQALIPEAERGSEKAALHSLKRVGMAVFLDEDVLNSEVERQGITPDLKSRLTIIKDVTAVCRLLPDEMLRPYARDLASPTDVISFNPEAFVNDPQTQEALHDRLTDIQHDAAQARGRLIESNLRWVVRLARSYMGRGLDFEDLVQDGNLGLIRAAEKYEYHMGFKFSTYSAWWIKQTITRAIGDKARTIRVPIHMGEEIHKVAGVSKILFQDLERNPTPEEIGLVLDYEPDRVREILTAATRTMPLSLDAPLKGDEEEDMTSYLQVDNVQSPHEKAVEGITRETVRALLGELDPREQLVIELRYGLEDGRDRTLAEVGEALGVTRERARQIESRAIKKLRVPSRSRRLSGFLD